MKTKKVKGFMLLPAVLMSILLGLIGVSFVQIYAGQFNAMSSGRKAIQALQYAQSEADFLRNVDYANVASSAHGRTDIAGASGWQSQVTVGGETTVAGVKQRLATVNVYRNSTAAQPEFSLQVPLSSADGSGQYVQNKNHIDDYTDNTKLSVYYDSTDDLLHGYANDTEKYFNSSIQVPDYSQIAMFVNEDGIYTKSYGYIITDHNPSIALSTHPHPWVQDADGSHDFSYCPRKTIAEDGFVFCHASHWQSRTLAGFTTRLLVGILPPYGGNIYLFDSQSYMDEPITDSQYFPVKKGDVVFWSTGNIFNKSPEGYYIQFAPVKKS